MSDAASTTGNPQKAGMCPRCGGQLYAGLTHVCTTGVRSAASDPDGPEAFEGTLMDGLENEPPYPPREQAAATTESREALGRQIAADSQEKARRAVRTLVNELKKERKGMKC